MSSTLLEYDALFDEVVKTSLEESNEWVLEERPVFDRSRSISEVIKPISPMDLDNASDHAIHHAPTLRLDTLTIEVPSTRRPDTRTRLTELSQQMRTLLQSVIGYSEIIEEDLRAGDITSPLDDLATIRTASHRLLNLAREVEQQIDGERQKRRVAERLAALGEHALDTNEPAPLYEALLEHLYAALDFDEGHITMVGEDKPLVSLGGTDKLPIDPAQHASFVEACQHHGVPCVQTFGELHALAIPLEIEGKSVAVTTLFTSAAAGFDSLHAGTAVAFTAQAARVLQTLAHRDRLSKRATYDNLTGLLNRATFLERASRRWAGDGLKGAIMLDIDHFKSINDTYGHAAGDMVLREAARRLCATVRGDDEIGRLGGEEFALALTKILAKDAEDLAERLRMSISSRPFDIGIAAPLEVTVSVGVATDQDMSVEDLLARADEALYQAKRSGRNRVVCA